MIGYRSTVINGVRWRENQGGLLPLSPPHMLDNVSKKLARSLLRKEKSLFVRWESDFDQCIDTSWWHIINDRSVNLIDFSGNTRSKIRRGLKVFECSPVTQDVILKDGYDVYKSAFNRYNTHEKKYFKAEFINAIQSMPENTEFWGVRNKDTHDLVAFSENYVEDETVFYNTIWFEPSGLSKYSSYALFYEMNRYYLEEKKFRYVSDGARSLSHQTQIHDFLKSKFGFRYAYAQLHVVYVPWFGMLVSIAYRFRNLIKKIHWGPFRKATILLKQEEIRRKCSRMNT
jgi:hypothetical protein